MATNLVTFACIETSVGQQMIFYQEFETEGPLSKDAIEEIRHMIVTTLRKSEEESRFQVALVNVHPYENRDEGEAFTYEHKATTDF